MKNFSKIIATLFAGIIFMTANSLTAAETVTVDNFVRAETDMTLKRYVDLWDLESFSTFESLHQLTNKA